MKEVRIERFNSDGYKWKDLTTYVRFGENPQKTMIWAHRMYGRYPRVEVKTVMCWNNLYRRAELVHTPTGVVKKVYFWHCS